MFSFQWLTLSRSWFDDYSTEESNLEFSGIGEIGESEAEKLKGSEHIQIWEAQGNDRNQSVLEKV